MNKLRMERKDAKRIAPLQVWHARTLWQRLRGLIARPALKAGEGLLITPCNSVHTLGMRYALDLVFLDKHGSVVKCVSGLKPYRMAAARKARHALELVAGSIAEAEISVGDCFVWNSPGRSPRQVVTEEKTN